MCFRFLLVAGFGMWSALSFAQTPGEAFLAYERGEFEKAAFMFAKVLENKSTALAKDEAEYGLAMSLLKAKYYMGALKHFENIVEKGEAQTYFVRAMEGMLEATTSVGGEVLIAQLLDGIYDSSAGALSKVKPALIQHIHFMIASRAFRSGHVDESNEFASTVDKQHRDYARAQYVMGLSALKGIGHVKATDYKQALEHFENVRQAKSADGKVSELKQMATLALARVYYEMAYAMADDDKNRQATMLQAIEEYHSIPRFSPMWADALFEQAWAYTVIEDYGGALGALYSLKHPYFANAFFPEADVLSAIVYWYNCQWDKAAQAIDNFRTTYAVQSEQLKSLLNRKVKDEDWYQLLQQKEQLPAQIAHWLKQERQYEVFQTLFEHIDHERESLVKSAILKDTQLARDALGYLDAAKEDLRKTVGKWVRASLQRSANEIEDMVTRAGIISLETKTAETKWLEQGHTTSGKERRRLARAHIADDGYQFWWKSPREHWIDELGFYRYSVQSECLE